MRSVVFPIVMALDFAVPLLVALPYRGYSHRSMALSVLGCENSPLAWAYNLWTILSGAVFVGVGVMLFRHEPPVTMLGILLVLYGVGCEILSGLFPVGESKAVITLSAQIHGIGSVIGFLALLFAPLALGILQLRGGSTGFGAASIACFVLALAAFALFVMADKPQFQGGLISDEGLWQRVSLAFMYLPLLFWALGAH